MERRECYRRRELAEWRRDMRRVAERRARQAWGGCPKGNRLGNALELAACLALTAFVGAMCWLFLAATPEQSGAEADIERATPAIAGAAE